MRKTLLALLAPVLLISGCASGSETVSPGDGPADSQTSKEPATKAPAGESKPKVASFTDKHTYSDGVEIEVTKIDTKKLTESAAVGDNSGKKGDPYTAFTVRVRNGGTKTLDASGTGTVTYGPDGDEAQTVFDSGVDGGIDGKVLPGKAKTSKYGFVIPAKYQSDVTLEFSADFEHEAAVFTGSIK